MERVRLMAWCRTCVTGAHLPVFAAAEGGLFAERGIEVEFVDCLRAPDFTVEGFATRPMAVAAGRADFALTSVTYLLAAQNMSGGRLPVRFAAISHQRNPICGVVRADSRIETAFDLGGLRTARWRMYWFAHDYAGALRHCGIRAPELVDVPYYTDEALGSGEVDVIPTWVDMTFHHGDAGFPIRVIPLDIHVYTTGLVAADRLDRELVASFRDAFLEGYELQRAEPELGVAGFCRRFPDVSARHARAAWSGFESYAFDGPPGRMDVQRWEDTIRYTARTHGLSDLPGERMYRPELLTPPREFVASGDGADLAPVYELRDRIPT